MSQVVSIDGGYANYIRHHIENDTFISISFANEIHKVKNNSEHIFKYIHEKKLQYFISALIINVRYVDCCSSMLSSILNLKIMFTTINVK